MPIKPKPEYWINFCKTRILKETPSDLSIKLALLLMLAPLLMAFYSLACPVRQMAWKERKFL